MGALRPTMWQVRLAGLSGAASIGLGAVGAHKLKDQPDKYKNIWKTSVQYHQFGTVALLGCASVPSARARMVGGVGIAAGTALFCGSNYMVAYYQDSQYAKAGPAGGMVMMAGLAAL